MPLSRRRLLQLAGAAALLPAAPHVALGAGRYPTRPVRIDRRPGGRQRVRHRRAPDRRNGCRSSSASNSSSRTGPAPAATSRPRPSSHAPPDGYTLLLVNAQNTHQRRALRKAQLRFRSATSRRSAASIACRW